jgi:hypothetical protein
MSVGRLLEVRVYRSLRPRGQLLVLVAALLGAVMGVAFGLTGERGDTAAVAAPGRVGRVAPASSRPPASRAAGSGGQAGSSDPAVHQRAESVDRPGEGHDKPHRHERDRDKPGGHGEDKLGGHGKDKGRDK